MSNSVVFKYIIGDELQEIEMPVGAKIISVHAQDDKFCMWAIVDPQAEKEIRKFVYFGTGNTLIDDVEYIGTAYFFDARLVLHLFEVKNER